jgi:archaellum component FlaC
MREELAEIEARLEALENRRDAFQGKIDVLEKQMYAHDDEIKRLEERSYSIEMTLLDADRDPDDAIPYSAPFA